MGDHVVFDPIQGELEMDPIVPDSNGGSDGGLPVYLTALVSITNPAYKQSSYTHDLLETIESGVVNNNEILVRTYQFDADVSVAQINAGNWKFHFHAMASSAAQSSYLRIEVYKRSALGVETVLFSATSPEINSTSMVEYLFETTQPIFDLDPTDRLGARVYVSTTRSSNTTVSYVIGDGDAAYLMTPLPLRHSQTRGRNEPGSHPAEAISYDNTESGLSANDVKEAIDELAASGGRGPAPVEVYRTSGIAIPHTCYSAYPKAGTLSYVRVSSRVLPIGGNLEVNVKKAGVTVLSGNLAITPTEPTFVVGTGEVGKATVDSGAYDGTQLMEIEIIPGSGNTFLGADLRIECGYANS